ncbi:probable inactive serine/threonine-protein kinase fnkC [Trifolium pratense]|uniref:probable inactive serine/threonine-protein kinase fnkC n=1 Tax=Trifolium pratense TaxID=57577 RepID=UPI001E698282|nr:probable inactive serine/threonine-protein kinase fnkC [Trifolium pratense]
MNTKYVSNDFQFGGHKWKLVLHPGDNSQRNDKGYVSLYLQIADTEKYANGWKVNVNFKLFVYDQMHKNYLTIQDAGGAVRTFSEKNTELGFEELISLKELKDKSNGYLVNDSCEFGAEVFVYGGHSAKSEILSMIKNPTNDSFTWKFGKFSTLQDTSYESNIQHVGERDWSLLIYPKGNKTSEYVSLYLDLKNCAANRTVYATYTIKILDQLHNRHHKKTASDWFRPSSAVAGNWMKAAVNNWLGSSSSNAIGYSKFISLSELNKATNGFIVKDVISMEVEIQVSMTKFSSN